MSPHLAAVRVLLPQIDLDDDTFSLLPWLETAVPEALTRSIARAGLLHPPLLQAKAATRFRVIAGRRRLLALREAQAAGCLCLVLAAEAPDLEGLALSLEDTLALRPLSAVEQALFLRKAGRHLDPGQLAERYFPLLGLAPGMDLRKPARLLGLEEPLLRSLHAGRLGETAALELAALPFVDRWALFEIIELVGIGPGDQPRLTAACQEAARREKRSVLDLLAAPAAKEILEDQGGGPTRQMERLLAWLSEGERS
ncbi:MAG: ParB N-terminal domain-containing protein [Desulfobacteraceae bacterium]|nr:ParB N-terminal domain-containing protein [Desulfobacteraceae bacterium]